MELSVSGLLEVGLCRGGGWEECGKGGGGGGGEG